LEIHSDNPAYAEKIVAACKDHKGLRPSHLMEAIDKGAISKLDVLAAAGREAGLP